VTDQRTFKPWPDARAAKRNHFFTDCPDWHVQAQRQGVCSMAPIALFLGHQNNKASKPEDP
jgi:hypothetical protein